MALQHLRSSTANKRPTPGSMSDGQLALNTNLASPGLFFKDSNGDLVKVGPVHVGTTAPNVSPAGQSGNSKGEQWLDTSSSRYVFKIWDGTAWRSEAGEFVDVSGDTMTGALGIIAGSASTPGLFFSGDANSGLYSPGADQVAVATNGTGRLTVDTAATTSTLPVVHPLGAVGTPSITFTGDLNTGFWSPSADALAASTAGSERLRITSAGLVGIGTSSPAELLHVSGGNIRFGSTGFIGEDAALSPAPIRFGPNPGSTFSVARDLEFYANPSGGASTVRMILKGQTGNVGIGVTGPGSLLHLAATGTSTNAEIIIAGTNTNGDPSCQARIGATQDGALTSGALTFSTRLSGTTSERARIDSSGRLLVGTSSASGTNTLFESSSTTANAANVALVKRNSGTADQAGQQLHFYNFGPAGTGRAADTEVGSMRFYGSQPTSGAAQEMARITCAADLLQTGTNTSGRLVFSTTADGASSPTERMRIASDGSTNHYTDHTNVHIARSGNAAGTTDSIYVGVRSATNTINGTVVYRVYTNGTFATISDANQKKNVETTRDGYLDDLNKLRVVKYNWNEQEDTDPKELGLIAQEVEQVFPGLVTQIADDTEEQQYKGIKNSVLPFMLLKALQEASAKIEVLEAEVAALKAQ